MHRYILLLSLASALVFPAVLVPSPALAEKSAQAGGKAAENHGNKDAQGKPKQQKGQRPALSGDEGRHNLKESKHFSAEHRRFIHKYYGDRFRSGPCPPGLAKKGNGCMPPGQAKKWMTGRPLPRGVVFYDLPPEVLVRLGPVPSRHRFVRVASDILLIALGTGMVVDAIEDIGRERGRE